MEEEKAETQERREIFAAVRKQIFERI